MEKTIYDIFGESSKSLDFDGSEKLIVGVIFELDDFNIIFSQKYSADCALIKGFDGKVWSTWSSVIVKKLTELKDLDVTKWKGVKFQTISRISKTDREYLDLKII